MTIANPYGDALVGTAEYERRSNALSRDLALRSAQLAKEKPALIDYAEIGAAVEASKARAAARAARPSKPRTSVRRGR